MRWGTSVQRGHPKRALHHVFVNHRSIQEGAFAAIFPNMEAPDRVITLTPQSTSAYTLSKIQCFASTPTLHNALIQDMFIDLFHSNL